MLEPQLLVLYKAKHLSNCQCLEAGDSNQTIDIIMDNAGFELFTDLCLADYLCSAKLVKKVNSKNVILLNPEVQFRSSYFDLLSVGEFSISAFKIFEELIFISYLSNRVSVFVSLDLVNGCTDRCTICRKVSYCS